MRARDPYSSPLVTNYCPDTLIVFLEGSIYSIQIFPEKDSSLITRIGRINAFNVYKIYADKKLDENSLWLATSTGLLKFDLSKRESQSEIKTFVRSVMIGDSAWFSGVSTGKELLKLSPGSSITINFSALSFEDESSVLYQTYMEGIDTSWQQLNKNSFREFASLSRVTTNSGCVASSPRASPPRTKYFILKSGTTGTQTIMLTSSIF
ncbi:MAG: hypothetical protein IPG53_17990 [Ignavibacteriales bacterium]|nr:hypothetical protein [Ignavibacteriales bacterium]